MVVLTDDSYCPNLMEELWRQAKEGSPYADLLLNYDGRSFCVHSCILTVAAPDVFKDFEIRKRTAHSVNVDIVFGESVKNSGSSYGVRAAEKNNAGKVDDANNLSVELFEEILHFLYTGIIHIPDERLDHVLSFAKKYRIESLVNVHRGGKTTSADPDDKGEKNTLTIMIESGKYDIVLAAEESHKETKELENIEKFTCVECKKEFDTPADLSKHYAAGHEEGDKPLDNGDATIEGLICPYCPTSCEDVRSLKQHKLKHKCTKCNKVHGTIKAREGHKCGRTNTRTVYECSVCRKVYVTKKSFIGHQKRHLKSGSPTSQTPIMDTEAEVERIFVDEAGGEIFKPPTECTPATQSPRHPRGIPFQCHDCQKIYQTKHGLQMHINSVHLQKFQYKCGQCGRTFAQSSHLSDHKRVHSKERKHVCSFCGLGVCTKINLKRHESMHTGIRDFSCVICENKFAVPHDLKRHVQTQHSDATAVCDVCGRPFKKASQLRKHNNKDHPVIKPPKRRKTVERMELNHFALLTDAGDLSQTGNIAPVGAMGPENTILAVIPPQPLINSMWKDRPLE